MNVHFCLGPQYEFKGLGFYYIRLMEIMHTDSVWVLREQDGTHKQDVDMDIAAS